MVKLEESKAAPEKVFYWYICKKWKQHLKTPKKTYHLKITINSKHGEIEDSNRFWLSRGPIEDSGRIWLSMVKLEESKAAPEKVFYRYIAKK